MTDSSARAAVRCTGLIKRYGEVLAVDGLDLDVATGECFGLLGPNGAGKTTTVEILEGLLTPDAGVVELLGLRWATDAQQLRERIGVQLQDTRLSERLTVVETLRLFASFYPGSRGIEPLLDVVGLASKRDARAGKLSGGQKQRLSVACALVGEPDLLFLDEPTTGLDPQSRLQLWDLLRRFKAEGRTILLTTHYMDEAAALCDRLAIVDRGRVVALGAPASLIASLGAGEIIRFTAAGSGPPAEREALASLPAVRDVRLEGTEWALASAEAHVTLPALLAYLDRRSSHLTTLSTHRATLEDVFVALTGRHLRDD
jgi:ABC-2 type transport system ATP-binding protein